MRILIDTNVLLRSTEPGHSHYQCSVDAIDILRRLGHELTIVPQLLYEFWSVATRPLASNALGMSPADVHAEITTLTKLFRLLRDERGEKQSAWHLCSTCASVPTLIYARQLFRQNEQLEFRHPDFAVQFPIRAADRVIAE